MHATTNIRTKADAGEAALVVATVLVLPCVFFLAQQGPALRLLYPACNLLVAAYLYYRRTPWYVGHCVLLFCCVSLVRRWVDFQAGWDPSNPILLTPYLCCLPAAFSFLNYWLQRSPKYLGAFLVLLLCLGYGVLLAVLNGRLFGSLVDALKWSIGPLFAVHILAHRDQLPALRPIVQGCLIWAGTAMALYGIWQFVSPSPWDAQWMRDVSELGLDSIGRPEPFAVRVFSTMNSPGSFGIMLIAGIVFALRQRLPVACITTTTMLIGLALCQYRSIWAATALAILLSLARPASGVRATNLVAALLMLGVISSVALLPQMREAIATRAASLQRLENDESLQTRLLQYRMLTRAESLVIGEGLAINGASQRLDKELPKHIDGAFIEIWRGMGIVVGSLFLGVMGLLVIRLFHLHGPVASEVYAERAIVMAIFVQLPLGSVHVGELGFCAWLFIGFVLASKINATLPGRDTATLPTGMTTLPAVAAR